MIYAFIKRIVNNNIETWARISYIPNASLSNERTINLFRKKGKGSFGIMNLCQRI